MNSNYKKPTNSTSSFNFDLNLGSSSQNRSLNDQKTNKTPSYTYQSKPNTDTTPSWQPKPSYTHQPPTRPGLPTGSPSMVGDIFGKTWGTSNINSGIGLVNKNPNLFGDLVGSALGQNSKNAQNVPLKSAAPVKGAFSMGGLADSVPKTGNLGGYNANTGNGMGGSVKSPNLGGYNANSGNGMGNNVKSSNLGGYGGGYSASSGNNVGNSTKSTNLGGQSMGSGSGRDPFASLGGFGSKPAGVGNSGKKPNPQKDASFGGFQDGTKVKSPEVENDFFGPGSSFDDLVKPKTENPPPGSENVFDSFFPSSSVKRSDGFGSNEQFSGGDDWGMDSDNNSGGTTELEGLPPPPAGVSASGAKSKGMDNYKQGQYADAIKWLSWAVILLEKAGDDVARMEVLSSRASCYKEVGEYKKAVADCTKVLEHDEKSVSALVQRAMLYESMEKYKLGADDLRTVMKLDPMNRVARSTIHRLNKMAG